MATQNGSTEPALGSRYRVLAVREPGQIVQVRALFEAYARSLEIDLSFQRFDEELAGLPGRYVPPEGELLLAYDALDNPVGCVALRRIDARTCEIKRLYVAPETRGTGLGRILAQAIVERARALGYGTAKLDTLASLQAALRLYEKLGFRDTPPYSTPPYGSGAGPEMRWLALIL